MPSERQAESGFIKFVDFMRSGRTRMGCIGILIALVSFGTAIGYVKLPSGARLLCLGLGMVSVALLIWGASDRTLPREDLIKIYISPLQIVVLCLTMALLLIFAYGQRWSGVIAMAVLTVLQVWVRIEAVNWRKDHAKSVGAVPPEP